MPASPRLAHAQVPIRRTNGAGAGADALAGLSPLRAGEKRRRPGEADEDDNLERLAAKRRPSDGGGGVKKEDGGGAGRKLKLKLAGAPHPGAKDGDTG
jgi:hypothetical protein